VNADGGLERAYRRQLAWYPAAHRRAHEEEMLGVLMTGARTGQRRPGLAESADLIWGALRIRLRPARDGSARALWRDALAVVSVVVPILFLVRFATSTAALLGSSGPEDPRFLAALAPLLAGELACLVTLVALVLLRLRRTAALAAAALLIWYVTGAGLVTGPNWSYIDPAAVMVVAALGLEIAALLASPGPRRGLQILTWKNYALVVLAAAAAGSTAWIPAAAVPLERAAVVTLVALTLGGMALASRLSRRIMVLLSFPLYYLALGYAVLPSVVYSLGSEESGWFGPLRMTLTFLPITALLVLALAAAARAVRHIILARRQDA
jgi:hypothetical protein